MPSVTETVRGVLHKEAAQHQTCTVPCAERRATLFFEVGELCAPPPQRVEDVFRCAVRDAGRESHQSLYPAAGLPGAGEDQPAKRKTSIEERGDTQGAGKCQDAIYFLLPCCVLPFLVSVWYPQAL